MSDLFTTLQDTIAALLKSGHSYRQITAITGASNVTIAKVKRKLTHRLSASNT